MAESEPTGFRGQLGEPPFFRGDKAEGGWEATVCDRLVDTTAGGACDQPSKYLIEWQQQPYDGGTIPVSGACERHALDVDRRQVVRMSTHPEAVMSGG